MDWLSDERIVKMGMGFRAPTPLAVLGSSSITSESPGVFGAFTKNCWDSFGVGLAALRALAIILIVVILALQTDDVHQADQEHCTGLETVGSPNYLEHLRYCKIRSKIVDPDFDPSNGVGRRAMLEQRGLWE